MADLWALREVSLTDVAFTQAISQCVNSDSLQLLVHEYTVQTDKKVSPECVFQYYMYMNENQVFVLLDAMKH